MLRPYGVRFAWPLSAVVCSLQNKRRLAHEVFGVAGVLLGLSLLGVPALADEAKQPVPRVGQVVIESMGPASGTIPKGKLATIVNYIHADKHTWYKNGSRHTAKYPFNKGTQRNLHDRFVLKMRYGLGDGYDVRFTTPIVMNNFRAHSTLTPNSVSSKNGIGDTTFVLHKQFLSQREGSPVDMAWDLGVWTPTAARPTTAWAQALGARWRASAWGTPLTAGGSSSKARLCICIAG